VVEDVLAEAKGASSQAEAEASCPGQVLQQLQAEKSPMQHSSGGVFEPYTDDA